MDFNEESERQEDNYDEKYEEDEIMEDDAEPEILSL